MLKTMIILAAALLTASCQSLDGRTSGKPRRTGIFEFHNSFWLNLHHFLHAQGLKDQPDTAWSRGDQESVTAAVKVYRDHYSKRDLVFDSGMVEIKDVLVRVGDSTDLYAVNLPEDLREALEKSAILYRNQLWSQHAALNDAWIEDAQDLITAYGPSVQRRLESSLQLPLDDAFYRIDVTHDAGWSGAYTTLPAHTVISSSEPANRGFAAIEILFQEVVHTGPFRLIGDELTMALTRSGKKDPGQLAHAVHFYTVGAAVERALAERGLSYVPYAEKKGLFGPSRSWGVLLPVLNEHWGPYLENKKTLRDSARSVIENLP